MLTFVSTLKKIDNTTYIQQINALRSWRHIFPECQIIIFGEVPNGWEKDLALDTVPLVNSSEVPKLDYMLKIAQQKTSYDYLCYINSDIILLPNVKNKFIATMKHRQKNQVNVLAAGRRVDLNIDDFIDFTSRWYEVLEDRAQNFGQMMFSNAIDIFFFNKNLYSYIPPLYIGRLAWDNWFLFAALCENAHLIDISADGDILHSRHNYAHVGLSDNIQELGTLSEAQSNVAMVGKFREYTLDLAQYKYANGKINKNDNLESIVLKQLRYWKSLAGTRDIAIFGIGATGKSVIDWMSVWGMRPAIIFDNNFELWGESYKGIKICSCDRYINEFILITSTWAEDIKAQLELCSLQETADFVIVMNIPGRII